MSDHFDFFDDHGPDDHGLPDHGLDDHGLDDHGLDDHGLDDHGLDDHGLDDGLGEHDWADDAAHDITHDPHGHDPHSDELPESLAEHPAAEPDDTYPPYLHLDLTPADGQDWVDPGLLGDSHGIDDEPQTTMASPQELLESLHAAAGGDDTPSWEAALHSDDPAIRSLAAFWHPEN